MEINEIKKALYKEKPIARKTSALIGLTDPPKPLNYEYKCQLANGVTVIFGVPCNDMGEKLFEEEMPAQLLIRWIVKIQKRLA